MKKKSFQIKENDEFCVEMYMERISSKCQAGKWGNVPENKGGKYSKTDFMEDLKSVLNKDGPEAALSLYETKLPAKYADDFDLLFLKAAINVSAENLDEAQALCNELSQRDPQNNDVASLAVVIAKMKGDNAERTKQVNSLLAKDKLNSAANVELGEDMFLKKNYNM